MKTLPVPNSNGIISGQTGDAKIANILKKRPTSNPAAANATPKIPSPTKDPTSEAVRTSADCDSNKTATTDEKAATNEKHILENPIAAKFCQTMLNKRSPAKSAPTGLGGMSTGSTMTTLNDGAEQENLLPARTRPAVLIPSMRLKPTTAAAGRGRRPPNGRLDGLWRRIKERDWTVSSVQIDRISMLLFPIAFGLFNLCYWCTYFLKMDRPM